MIKQKKKVASHCNGIAFFFLSLLFFILFPSLGHAQAASSIDQATIREVSATQSLADYLGPQTLQPIVYYESDWGSEEWTRGAYASSYDLGGLHRYGADQLRPVGPIHWSSSDLAAEGYQHVDGAVRMGEYTASVLADSLAESKA